MKQFTSEDGSVHTYLNPTEKGKKYAKELKEKKCYTNDLVPKKSENGRVRSLTKEQKAYRHGYLDARQDSANCYKAKNGLPIKRRTWVKKASKKE